MQRKFTNRRAFWTLAFAVIAAACGPSPYPDTAAQPTPVQTNASPLIILTADSLERDVERGACVA